MTLDLFVLADIRRLGLTRLVHFTPRRALGEILIVGEIRSRSALEAEPSGTFSPTDGNRYDGHRDKTCCSIEYPNAFYFNTAKTRPDHQNYEGWVCLLLDPELAARPGVLFSPLNAATKRGALLQPGAEGLRACFAPTVGKSTRGPRHLPSAPTDLQAEVLVPGSISVSDIRGIVVGSDAEAVKLRTRLNMIGVDGPAPWIVAPQFFEAKPLTAAIRSGRRVPEQHWMPQGSAT
ncbi:DarT ssDNA thymidine ADP-ribosyltransferase family protein [Stackebrandtia soli]|uniref:DarT ssDNA thymidine ADP-ribosyltransferase family protein n=1 Tax=Stackebrandtia soli TaxID=1892856 RepID=UPI0039ED3131